MINENLPADIARCNGVGDDAAVETVRFCASPEVLRKLAKQFEKTADETEAELKAATAPAARA